MAFGVSTFELASGILLISTLSVFAFVAPGHLAGPQKHRVSLFAVSLLLTLGFAWGLSGRLMWAVLIPATSAICFSNFMPVLLSLTAGMALRTQSLNHRWRWASSSAMIALAAAYCLAPIARPVLSPIVFDSAPLWKGKICLQSHSATCAPAAAATLLKLAGIESDESSMTQVCLTSTQGTVPLGLYRGLATAAESSQRQPKIASSNPDTWLASNQLPNVALVQFAQPHSQEQPGFFRGPTAEGHAIVVLDRAANGDWILIDPAFGKTRWSDEQFRSRFTGEAIYLSRR
jgi:hypothetical protein